MGKQGRKYLEKKRIIQKGFLRETRPLGISGRMMNFLWQTRFKSCAVSQSEMISNEDTETPHEITVELHREKDPFKFLSSQEKALFDANMSSISQHLPFVTRKKLRPQAKLPDNTPSKNLTIFFPFHYVYFTSTSICGFYLL